MSTISKPNTFSASTTISSSAVNANFDTLYNDYNGGITAANLATDSVTTAKIADSNVTTAKIADANVTSAKLSMQAWQSWTPTLGNLTLGSGTLACKYIQIGKTVIFRFVFIYGAGSAVGSSPTFTLPVTSATVVQGNAHIGTVRLGGVTGTSPGWILHTNTTTAGLVTADANSTFVRETAITSTNPFTWASTDAIAGSGTYEAA